MQPHDNNQRSEDGTSDGGRDAERSAFFTAIGMALEKVLKSPDGAVHYAEVGKPLNLSVTMTGSGNITTEQETFGRLPWIG
jgi:hypothetical protein